MYIPQEEYVVLLKRVLNEIRSGTPLRYTDSEDVGNKYTVCSWGLCGYEHAYRGYNQFCPFDRRDNNMAKNYPETSSGCFYRCRIFNPKGHLVGKEEAVILYNEMIESIETVGKGDGMYE